MSDTATMNIQLPMKLKEQIELLAKATDRSKSLCIAEAIQAYLDKEVWQIEAIREGIKSADEGRMIDHTRVAEWVESWDTKDETKKPACG